ncbi:serine/threonine protein kinase (plasmid) [Mesorhizobium sp. AR10]|uniref:serine/threonine-protein kinase n=1 Tax=Mesorhizobium sp. AR10 TaxID=2865839 RepID=UPI00215E978A|nr:serine/threonine-protein kinase [Mesorhizobium sp. AR10]UVK35987.1 serine/threonine protein kinase [Mesorhizobium sp. AR10]
MFKPLQYAQLSFELKDEIGAEGKNSSTFIAHDNQLGADIVVKRIDKEDIEHRETYFEESRRLYASTHPHVVQLHYACETDDHVFVAMPLYSNGSLKSYIQKNGHLTVREIVNFGCQIAAGLHNIHSKGLIHFDLKADNVLISDRHEALISDFGLAMAQDEAGEASPDGIYTPITPPEAISGHTYDRSFDIYQFGMTLYVMCNGVECLDEQMAKFENAETLDGDAFSDSIEKGTYPERKTFLAHIPKRLRKIVCRCLEVEPGDRYKSALDVANELAAVEGSLDWRFSESGNCRVWTRDVDGALHVLTVDESGKSELTKAINGGKAKRVTAGCKSKLTDAAVTVLLGIT